MDLKEEFLAALRCGQGYEPLLELVQRHIDQGMAAEEAYDILEGIWMDFGYDNSVETSPLRDDLEFVMEKVWFQGTGSR